MSDHGKHEAVADQHSQHALGAVVKFQDNLRQSERASKTSRFAPEHSDDKVELDATAEESAALSDGQS